MGRVYYTSPQEAFDHYKVEISVQEAYEAYVPKVFGMTKTPPFFEDPFPENMATMLAPLNILVDIHTGGYIYSLKHPEEDIPNIVLYLGWFVDTFKALHMDKEQQVTFNKICEVYNFYKDWKERVEHARDKAANKGKRIRSFAEGGYAK